MKKEKNMYQILQGIAKRQSDGTLTNYDLELRCEFTNKAEAFKEFNRLKKDTKGWSSAYNVLITVLELRKDYWDEEYQDYVCYDDNEILAQDERKIN